MRGHAPGERAGMAGKVVSGAVAWGLFAAWAAHDAEELATMARWTAEARPRLRARFPGVPDGVWRRLDLSQREVNTAVGLMGKVVAAASAAGVRTGGRSAFFQTCVVGFGLHGVVHLAQSAAYRGYTPGVVTAPLVVIPYTVHALRRLASSGISVRGGRSAVTGTLLFPVVAAGVHIAARRIDRR
ncbi:HXXEE domain-containing protein [Streptomyces halstedii]|uniref:HXXEE domain-containing protein n=1 Tax=Streptomyces halstedii TaxID=1944 RepID=UPI00345F9356